MNPTTHITINLSEPTYATGTVSLVVSEPFATVSETSGAPIAVPEDEMYFWSSKWQHFEAEADADIAAGRTRRFANSSDAIRALLSDD